MDIKNTKERETEEEKSKTIEIRKLFFIKEKLWDGHLKFEDDN